MKKYMFILLTLILCSCQQSYNLGETTRDTIFIIDNKSSFDIEIPSNNIEGFEFDSYVVKAGERKEVENFNEPNENQFERYIYFNDEIINSVVAIGKSENTFVKNNIRYYVYEYFDYDIIVEMLNTKFDITIKNESSYDCVIWGDNNLRRKIAEIKANDEYKFTCNYKPFDLFIDISTFSTWHIEDFSNVDKNNNSIIYTIDDYSVDTKVRPLQQ